MTEWTMTDEQFDNLTITLGFPRDTLGSVVVTYSDIVSGKADRLLELHKQKATKVIQERAVRKMLANDADEPIIR